MCKRAARAPRQPRTGPAERDVADLSSAEAADKFRDQTGIDAFADPLVQAAVEAARVADYLTHVQVTLAWAKELRRVLSWMPAVPAMTPPPDDRRPARVSPSFAAAVDLVLEPLFEVAKRLDRVVKDLLHEEPDPFAPDAKPGLAQTLALGRAITRRSTHRPANVSARGFAYTLDYLWKQADRLALDGETVALAARATGVGAWNGDVVRRWQRVLREVQRLDVDRGQPECVGPEQVVIWSMLQQCSGNPAALVRRLLRDQYLPR